MGDKEKKKNKKGSGDVVPNWNLKDERFTQVLNDPRFRKMRRFDRKVKVDSRFKSMFTDDKFKLSSKTDKRGQKISQKEENLKTFYDVSDEEKEKEQNGEKKGLDSDDDDEEDETMGSKCKVPDARGGGDDVFSSSSDESSSEDEEEEIELDHAWGELDRDATRSGDVSKRLAVCNIDWDRIKVLDLFVLFHSFKPVDGSVLSVHIYPSEFGKQRMAEEELNGPSEIVNSKTIEPSDHDDEENRIEHEEGDADDHREIKEKLRQYQLNRLKYYYAIVECDSIPTAEVLYKELDGFEYESSASTLDVRFIPDEVSFEQDEPSQSCTSMPDMTTYKAPIFITTALQQSHVQMTWDETDPTRKEKMEKAFDAGNENALNDLDAYLASSSEEEEDDDDESGNKVIGEDDEEEDDDQVLESKNESDDGSVEKTHHSNRDDNEDASEPDFIQTMDLRTQKGKKETKEEKIQKYKDLLREIEEEEMKGKQPEMEITFNEDGEGSDDEIQFEETSSSEDEMIGHSSKQGTTHLGSKQDMKQQNSKEKKKNLKRKLHQKDEDEMEDSDEEQKGNNRNELNLLMMDEEEGKNHFNYNEIVNGVTASSKKRKNKKEMKKQKLEEKEKRVQQDDFTFNPDDDRFSKIYSSHLYNIDPSDPHFKKTPAMESLIHRKALKTKTKDGKSIMEPEASSSVPGEDEKASSGVGGGGGKNPTISGLVASVKANINKLNRKSKNNNNLS